MRKCPASTKLPTSAQVTVIQTQLASYHKVAGPTSVMKVMTCMVAK